MTYGFQIYAPDGTLQLDSSSSTKIVYAIVDMLNTSGSVSYPALAGYTVSAIPMMYATNYFAAWIPGYTVVHTVSISYTSGYPVISWTSPGAWCSYERLIISLEI